MDYDLIPKDPEPNDAILGIETLDVIHLGSSYRAVTTLALDPLETAWLVQNTFAPYLKRQASVGLWLPGQDRPVIVPGRLYFHQSSDGCSMEVKEITAATLKTIEGDIFNEEGKRVLTDSQRSRVRDEPTVPVEGIRIVRADVQNTIDERSRKWSRKPFDTIDVVLRPLLADEYAGNEKLLTDLMEPLSDLRRQVIDFMGDDPWIMHFLRERGMGHDILVDKSIDYRIYDWERRMRSGEWV